MFQSVRLWWTDGRGKITLRLFAFEFLVVMAGVLAAQWLQQRQENIVLRREAQALIATNQTTYARMIGRFAYWRDHGPCVIDRAMSIARAAGEGRPLSKAQIGRPALPMVEAVEWTTPLRAAALDVVGAEKLSAYRSIELNSALIEDVSRKVADDWAIFALIDPANGKASPLDLSNVRLAAIRVANNVRLLQYKFGEFKPEIEILGIPPEELLSNSEVDSCGMIRNWD